MNNDTDTVKLQQSVDELKRQVDVLIASSTITRDISFDEQDAIREIVSDKIIDINWKDYFHFSTFFEGLEGWSDGGDTHSIAANRLFLKSNSTSGVAYASKRATYQNILSYDSESRFRTAFDVGITASLQEFSDIEAYAGTGTGATNISDNHIFDEGLAGAKHYGVYLNNATLYGVTSDGVNYTTTPLVTGVDSYDLFFVEIVHHPRERVVFYVSEPTNAITNPQVKPVHERGAISTTLPTGARTMIAEFAVKGDAEMDVGFVELIQERSSGVTK